MNGSLKKSNCMNDLKEDNLGNEWMNRVTISTVTGMPTTKFIYDEYMSQEQF